MKRVTASDLRAHVEHAKRHALHRHRSVDVCRVGPVDLPTYRLYLRGDTPEGLVVLHTVAADGSVTPPLPAQE